MQQWGRQLQKRDSATRSSTAWPSKKCLQDKMLPSDEIFAAGGIAAFRTGKLQEALVMFDNSISQNPRNAKAWLYTGMIYRQVGASTHDIQSIDHAIKCISKSIACGNSTAVAYTERALAYRLKGAIAEAKADVKNALELDANHAEAYAVLGNCRNAEGRHGEAIIAISKYCELTPDDKETAGALREYAKQYAARVKQYEMRTRPKILTITKLVPVKLPDGAWMCDFRQAFIQVQRVRE